MADEKNGTNQGPEHTEEIGRTRMKIWRNEKDGNERLSPTLEAAYRDKDGNWQQQKINLNHGDLLNVAKVAERAEEYINNDRQDKALAKVKELKSKDREMGHAQELSP